MAIFVVSVVLLALLVGSFTVLAARGAWSEDSLAYALYQLVTGKTHDVVEVGLIVFVALVLFAFAYFAACGLQSFVAEIGLKTFVVFMSTTIGALALGSIVSAFIFPSLLQLIGR
ncbi:MAG: hypothetical protein Q8R39_02530 [bacterium]|nr:hypothetical protein [bacterium]MDZ4284961.1 hypothetical protein [Patescibacteria group bacterium]